MKIKLQIGDIDEWFDKNLIIAKKIHGCIIESEIVPQIGWYIRISDFKHELNLTDEDVFTFEEGNLDNMTIRYIRLGKNEVLATLFSEYYFEL